MQQREDQMREELAGFAQAVPSALSDYFRVSHRTQKGRERTILLLLQQRRHQCSERCPPMTAQMYQIGRAHV